MTQMTPQRKQPEKPLKKKTPTKERSRLRKKSLERGLKKLKIYLVEKNEPKKMVQPLTLEGPDLQTLSVPKA